MPPIQPDPPDGEKIERAAIRNEWSLTKMHRKQAFWQIAFPLIIGTLIALGLGFWVVLTPTINQDVSLYWANISTLVLILFGSLLGLLALGMICGIIYGLSKVKPNILIYMQVALSYVYRIAGYTHKLADHSVKPVYYIQSGAAGFKALADRIFHTFRL